MVLHPWSLLLVTLLSRTQAVLMLTTRWTTPPTTLTLTSLLVFDGTRFVIQSFLREALCFRQCVPTLYYFSPHVLLLFLPLLYLIRLPTCIVPGIKLSSRLLSCPSTSVCMIKLICLLLYSNFPYLSALSCNTLEPGPTYGHVARPLYPYPQLRRLAKVAPVRKVQKPMPSSKCWHGLVGNA